MLKRDSLQQPWLSSVITSLTVGVAWVTSSALPVAARPLIVQSSTCSSVIYGSPIPAPVPVNPATGQPCSVSSPKYRDYDSIRTPIRGTIRNSTLINPTIIDSTISDSVLVEPIIINSSRSNRRTVLRSRVIYPSSEIRIRIEQ